MGEIVPRLQGRSKFGSFDAYECEIRDQAKENVGIECQKRREAGKIKILMVVKPKRAKWRSAVYRSKSEQTQPGRPNSRPKTKSDQGRQNCDSASGKRWKVFQKFAVEQSVESVEVDLSPWHSAKWRVQLVLLPLSFRSNDDDFVADQFTGTVIVLPVFRNKDFEKRPWAETLSRPSRETDKVLREIVWNQFRVPGF